MAQPLNISTYKLTKNINKKPQYKFKELQFGDGYRQIALDGINYQYEEWILQFIPMTGALSTALENLLLNSVNGTSNYLSWTPPAESTTKYWTAHNVNKIFLDTEQWQVSCVLRREFPIS